METFVVEIKLRVQIPAPNPGMAATTIADILNRALLTSAPFSTRGMTMKATAWAPPAGELTNKHT
jgi:hypothetical protein